MSKQKSIPLEEVNKEIVQECRDEAKHLLECADIIECKEPTNDEKLWKEIENCLEYADDDIYYGDSVFLRTKSIENLMDWFKNKETSLLKEFVEWLKNRYPISKVIFFFELDRDLEKFLEENKDAQ